VFEEVDEFFVGHGSECIVVRFFPPTVPGQGSQSSQRCSAKLVRHE